MMQFCSCLDYVSLFCTPDLYCSFQLRKSELVAPAMPTRVHRTGLAAQR